MIKKNTFLYLQSINQSKYLIKTDISALYGPWTETKYVHFLIFSPVQVVSSSSVNPAGQRLLRPLDTRGCVERGGVVRWRGLVASPSRLNVPLCLWTPARAIRWRWLYPLPGHHGCYGIMPIEVARQSDVLMNETTNPRAGWLASAAENAAG